LWRKNVQVGIQAAKVVPFLAAINKVFFHRQDPQRPLRQQNPRVKD
jgi:hypothetical protein